MSSDESFFSFRVIFSNVMLILYRSLCKLNFFQSWVILHHFLNRKVCKLIFFWFCNVKVTTCDVSSVCGWTVSEGRSCDSRGLEPPWNPRAVSLPIHQFLESLVSHRWSGTGQVITVHSLGLYNTKPWTCPNLNVFPFPNSWMIGRDLWPLTWEVYCWYWQGLYGRSVSAAWPLFLIIET